VQGTTNRIRRWFFDGNWQWKWWPNKIKDNGVVAASPLRRPSRRVPSHVLTKRKQNEGKWNPNARKFNYTKTMYVIRPCSDCGKLHWAIVHVTLDVISAVFALESICWNMRVEIAKVLIISGDFWRFLGVHVCIYGYPIVFECDFCTVVKCSTTLGNSLHWRVSGESDGKVFIATST
jgi:hypothetical protein